MSAHWRSHEYRGHRQRNMRDVPDWVYWLAFIKVVLVLIGILAWSGAQ